MLDSAILLMAAWLVACAAFPTWMLIGPDVRRAVRGMRKGGRKP